MAKEVKQIIIRDLNYSIDDNVILKNINLIISSDRRISIVGINGAGKTTFLKLLCSKLEPKEGSIEYTGNIKIGYIEQIHEEKDETVLEYLGNVFSLFKELETEMMKLEEQMKSNPNDFSILEKYSDTQDQFSVNGGYTYHTNIHQILVGIKFPKHLWEAKINSLSGGERTKIALAKILLEEPDLMLLDEPTNFLDIEAVEWLEYFLNEKWKKGFVIISHDRYFLDKVTKETYELKPGMEVEYYNANYSKYIEQREQREKNNWKKYEKQQEEIMRQTEIVQRLRAGSRASIAQSRMKMLDKLDRLETPFIIREPVITFKKADPSSESVLRFKDSFIGYDTNNPLYYIGELALNRGQRVAIMGPNGSGKTTLVKTILKEISILTGFISSGKDVKLGYYAQTLKSLNENNTIVDEIFEFSREMTKEQVRTFMGRFLFVGNEIFKKISELSGGERARVALAKLTLTPTNFLVLDEPTNHLDYLAREALEKGLSNYKGTILFISHDRYFVDKIATNLWVIDPKIGELRMHYGNYTDYKEREKRGSYNFLNEEQEKGEMMAGRKYKEGKR